MDFICKALLTAAVVALVMLVARHFGERVGGFVGSLPFTQFPALVWIGMSRGDVVVAQVAIGSVAGCVLSIGAATLLLSRLPASSAGGRRRPASMGGLAATAVFAGLLSAGLGAVGTDLDPEVAGIISTLPLIGAVAVMVEYRLSGAAGAAAFLRGYRVGSIGKTLFGMVVACSVTSLGLVTALALAILTGALACVAIHVTPVIGTTARRLLASLVMLALLTACGGGGSADVSESGTPPAAPPTTPPTTSPESPVAAPTAVFTAAATTCVQTAVAFDASGSAAGDGSALQYIWNFGDGVRGGGVRWAARAPPSSCRPMHLSPQPVRS